MTKLALIDVLLYNGTNLEQSGRISAGVNVLEQFGPDAIIICGDVDEQFTYFYVYENILRGGDGVVKADCIIMDQNGQFIFLYKLED